MVHKLALLRSGLNRIAVGPALLAMFLNGIPASPQFNGRADETAFASMAASRPSVTEREPLEEDLYPARRSLTRQAIDSNDSVVLERWARAEDWYGSAGPQAYRRLLEARLRENAPKDELVQISHRALQLSLREERFDDARFFSEKLADWGDKSAPTLLSPSESSNEQLVSIPGGIHALQFLLSGKKKLNGNDFLLCYSRMLTSIAVDQTLVDSRNLAQRVDEYFQQIKALSALGRQVNGHIEISLALTDQAGRERTKAALHMLGLKLNHDDGGYVIEWTEGKSETTRQDVQSALEIDQQTIQETLSAGGTYTLTIPIDSVSVYPAESVWRTAFPSYPYAPGGFTQFITDDPQIALLYLGLNTMDRAAANALLSSVSLSDLAAQWSRSLAMFSSALALNGDVAEVPGGPAANPVWQALVGESPNNPAAFFKSLLARDDGYLIAFFHDLSQLDFAHQQFFTQSAARARQYYMLFRQAREMRRGHAARLARTTFFDFIRDVPLNDSGSVSFPGSASVWMATTGHGKSIPPLSKLGEMLKDAPHPHSDDAVLARLAKTEYVIGSEYQSALANFDSVARINSQREEPLSPEAALLLSQAYPNFGALFPYFSDLGNLSASDYNDLFSLVNKLNRLDTLTANVRLGELHSYLEMICVIRRSGQISGKQAQEFYRRGIKRYIDSENASDWVIASLAAIADLSQLAPRRDAAPYDVLIRTLLIGAPPPSGANTGASRPTYALREHEAYQRILEAQRVPSLDAFFVIQDRLRNLSKDSGALETMAGQISSFVTIPVPYRWSITAERRKWIERCQVARLQSALSKLRHEVSTQENKGAAAEDAATNLLGELEPWISLAMAGQIYARYLDASDLIVSSDPLLLRKHQFSSSTWDPFWRGPCPRAEFIAVSSGEGSFFVGGFAEFGLAAGFARAEGNHFGGPTGWAFAGALFASMKATCWPGVTESVLQTFGATVRLAREWIVESNTSKPMLRELDQQSIGVLPPVRRKALLTAINSGDWQSVWDSLSVSDEFFIGKSLASRAPEDLWRNPAAVAMKRLATRSEVLDPLGPVAPDLSGAGTSRFRQYEPYEAYERCFMPQVVAQRTAELKLYLAFLADSAAWQSDLFAEIASTAADAAAKAMQVQDPWDWRGALEEYRVLNAGKIQSMLGEQ